MTPRHARKNRGTLWPKQAKDLTARTCLVDRHADRVAGAQCRIPAHVVQRKQFNRRDVELAGNGPEGITILNRILDDLIRGLSLGHGGGKRERWKQRQPQGEPKRLREPF